jgi:WD40 repeat protein
MFAKMQTWGGEMLCLQLRQVTADQQHLWLSAAADNCVKVWDLRVAGGCVRRLEGHTNRQSAMPIGCDFSPCGRYVAAGSEDKSAYLYDLRAGEFVERLGGHTDVVADVAFNPMHAQLVTAAYDCKLRFFADQ